MIERAGRWLANRAGAATTDELEERVEVVEARVQALTERLNKLEANQVPSTDRDRGGK